MSELKEYEVRLNAFEIGIIKGIMVKHGEADIPLALRMKFKKVTEQIYLESGFTPDQVYGKKEE